MLNPSNSDFRLSYFSFQPVIDDRCYPVRLCGMVHIPLLLIEKRSPCYLSGPLHWFIQKNIC